MRALDANILVYAHREECPQHEKALRLLIETSESPKAWALPIPCIYEFLRVVTHPRVFNPPTPWDKAWRSIENLTLSPSLRILHGGENHLEIFKQIVDESGVTGNLIHDAHIVTLLLEHGVSEIVTADRDFKRFNGIKTVYPF